MMAYNNTAANQEIASDEYSEQNGILFTSSMMMGAVEVPTDDDEDEDEDTPEDSTSDFEGQQRPNDMTSSTGFPSSSATTPPARRLVLLKRPNIPRGHSPASSSEVPVQDAEPPVAVATPSASSPAICSHEAGEASCGQCPPVDESSQPSSGSESPSRPSEVIAEENIKSHSTTMTSMTSMTANLTLEQREQAYEEARRRIFGSSSPSLDDDEIPVTIETTPFIHPPIVGQPRPMRPRPYQRTTPTLPLSMPPPGYPVTPFIPDNMSMNWSLYPSPIPSYSDPQNISSQCVVDQPHNHEMYNSGFIQQEFNNPSARSRMPFGPPQMRQPPPPPQHPASGYRHHFTQQPTSITCSDSSVIIPSPFHHHHPQQPHNNNINWDPRATAAIPSSRPKHHHHHHYPSSVSLSPQWGRGGAHPTALHSASLNTYPYHQNDHQTQAQATGAINHQSSTSTAAAATAVPPPPPLVAVADLSRSNHQISDASHVLSSSHLPPSQFTVQPNNFRIGRMEPRNMFADLIDPDFNRAATERKRQSGISGSQEQQSQSNSLPVQTYDSDFPPLG